MQIDHHIENELSFFAHASIRLANCATKNSIGNFRMKYAQLLPFDNSFLTLT